MPAPIQPLSKSALARVRARLVTPEPRAARRAIASFRSRIERYEVSSFLLRLATMMKVFLNMLRTYVDAKIEHAIARYVADSAEPGSRAHRQATQIAADHAATVDSASKALDEFAENTTIATQAPIADASVK